MNDKEFEAILPIIVGRLGFAIANSYHVDANEALDMLYHSELYATLENERSKLWHHSTNSLLSMFADEMTTGTIHYPDI